MSRAPGVNTKLILAPPPEKYDVRDQRELRRQIEHALSRPTSFDATNDIPANVTSLARLAGAADNVPYFTGLSTLALAALTPYARTILACADAVTARTALGLGPLAILAESGISTDLLHGDGAWGNATEDSLTLADVVTNDASTARHGFAPKGSGNASEFLDGTLNWSVPAGGGTTPPPFPSISNLELRFSARFSTVTLDSSGRVTNVTDLSGNARHSSTMSGSNRPLYLQTAFNGGPCFGFDGAASGPMHLLTVLGTTFAAPLTVVIVMHSYTNNGTASYDLYRDDVGGAVGFMAGAGAEWSMYNGIVVNSTALYNQSTTVPMHPGYVTHPTVRIDLYNGVSSLCCNNTTEVSIGDPGTSVGGIHSNLRIGCGFDSGAPSQAARVFISEFLLFSKALSLAERGLLRTYFASPLTSGVDLGF